MNVMNRIVLVVLCLSLVGAAISLIVLAWSIPNNSINGLRDAVDWLDRNDGDLEKALLTTLASLVGLLAFIDVPIVHFSVDWWRTLHQGPTVTRLDPQIDGLMLFTLMFSIATFALVYLWLLTHRFRLGYLQDQIDARAFDLALAERQAEAQPPPLASTGSPS